MKILAIADIHNNVACVRKLRAQELNGYDAIAIAGDIGTHGAADVFEILATFKCPIVYVHGNWDRMPEDASFGARAHLVHLEVVKVAGLAFAGYSFRGPPPQRLGLGSAEYAEQCRSLLRAAIRKSGVDLQRCVLITHDRARHLDRDFPNLLLHIYGHVHTFDVRQRGATTYVNASALDRMLPVAGRRSSKHLRYVNAGNYAVIDVGRSGKVSVECRLLRRNYQEWGVVGPPTSNGPLGKELIPEDAVFADPLDVPMQEVRRRGH
ncbi:MAG TPA: metallophosphoesterase family protein [Xanthobacteraceae bacterium]|jgi:predicted phosphodiesterase|nr:metallophosphoesterase family protein [Xanthobacteraceae bacterium]